MRALRRKDRALDSDATQALLHSCEYGVLATVDDSGQPYGVPLSYVYTDQAIYFHSAKIGHKLDNIRSNNRVSFTLVGQTKLLPELFGTEYESVVAFGVTSEVIGEERGMALLALLDKYAAEHVEAGKQYIKSKNTATQVIKVTISSVSGKARR